MGARQKHQRLKDGSPQDLNGLGKLRTQFDRKERERHRDYPHEKDNERFYRYRLFNFLHEHIKNRTFPSLTIEHYTELFEFKRRSYYDWINNQHRGRERTLWDDEIEKLIKTIHQNNHYLGYRNIADLLFVVYNKKITYNQVRRYMYYLGLKGEPLASKYYHHGKTTKKKMNAKNVRKENIFHWTTRKFGARYLLAGIEYEWVDTQNKFSSSQRHPENIIGVDEVYGSDSDYITSRSENSLRLTPIIDLISKKVIQYCFWEKGEGTKKVAECIERAVLGKHLLLFHTANDSELTSKAVENILKQHRILHSLCDPGVSWENPVESFFSVLLRWTKLNETWSKKQTRQEIEKIVNEFIERYNQLQDYKNLRKNLRPFNEKHRQFVNNYLKIT